MHEWWLYTINLIPCSGSSISIARVSHVSNVTKVTVNQIGAVILQLMFVLNYVAKAGVNKRI